MHLAWPFSPLWHYDSWLTWLCLLQKLLLEDNMCVQEAKRLARWGYKALNDLVAAQHF